MTRMQTNHPQRFEAAVRRFAEEHARDPNLILVAGAARPGELVYTQWLNDWVLKLCPEASEALRLAAHSQHLCRWTIPRDSYPMTRAGYLQWRQRLKQFHAAKAGEILRAVGYPDDLIDRVQALNLKKNFPHDPESRVLEDALCLVFLEHQLAELASKTADDKMVSVLVKALKKMTPAAHGFATGLSYAAHEKTLLDKALLEFSR